MWEAAIFPILFCIHDAEEIFTQHRWMREHGPRLKKRFPRMGKLLDHLGELSTGAFAVACMWHRRSRLYGGEPAYSA
ncbi:MAG: HXXEE domain-containing protein [Muribaculaceae bacterium]